MNTLTPLETLYDRQYEQQLLPLPAELANLYGSLGFPAHPDRPYIIGNFVTTLDGVVELDVPGHKGGGDISGFNQHDRMVMGLLRATADAVIVGAGTLNASPGHRWTAEHVYRPLAHAYRELRAALGKTRPPLNVIVSAQGKIHLNHVLFRSPEVPVLIVTTRQGAQQIEAQQPLSANTQMEVVPATGRLTVQDVVQTICRIRSCDVILVEGGPHLIGDFFAERYLDELFLTLAPQLAGRESSSDRPGLIAGKLFAPEHPLWGTLVGIKRAESHLFLRYGFEMEIRP
ncbi:MAG TPA: dihydrofolate reductase family protein [Ktedonosporobacter sp.]|jgi:riboflavin biosynthesis pyrimidine reductase|nr:dihydrofolate reductase family protein [Ktedonosporobacter sp.]